MNLFSISIDTISRGALLERIAESVAQKKPFRIATVNPEFLVRARRDTAFADSLFAADVRVRDGFGAGLLFWLRGRRAPGRITGADLVTDLLRLADENRWTVCIANRKGGLSTFSEIQKAIRQYYPHVIVTGGDFKEETQDARRKAQGSKMSNVKCQMLNAVLTPTSKFQLLNSQIVFCTFGAPEQEIFLCKLQKQGNSAVMIGVGGALDFFTKKQLRAPRWMGAVGLEWLSRCLRQPRRIGRIATAVLVFPLLAVRDLASRAFR